MKNNRIIGTRHWQMSTLYFFIWIMVVLPKILKKKMEQKMNQPQFKTFPSFR